MKKALIPGSFDPITVGHYDIIKRSSELFDEVHVVVFVNSSKNTMFTEEQRHIMINSTCSHLNNVYTEVSDKLVADYVLDNNIDVIIKGVRDTIDFCYEYNLSLINSSVHNKVETLLMLSKPEYMHISSAMVKEMIKYGKHISQYVPNCIPKMIADYR